MTGRGGARPAASDRASAASAEESLEELAALAGSAGAAVLDVAIQQRTAPEAATLIGAGKVREIGELAVALNAEVVIFDRELTPTQQRNLERALDCKVVDRTQLILDIFAARARTREGQLQVELAQLNYLLPRLAGRGTQMSRLGGGIGTRGPGETQLETDRRRIHRRIQRIQEELASVRGHRSVQRKQRQAVPLATVVLVGYTNAGKSTLFNRLTGASVLVDDRLFATLDPTIRVLRLPSGRRILLSDTVGFIRNLPTTLVQAFRATLEEVTEAALLLHVVDATSAHAAQHAAQVMKVLVEIGAEKTPQLLALNKADRLPAGEEAAVIRQRLAGEEAVAACSAVLVSALTGEGLPELLEVIDRTLPFDPLTQTRFRLPVSEGGKLHLLHELGRVIETRYDGDWCDVEAEVSDSLKRKLREYVVG